MPSMKAFSLFVLLSLPLLLSAWVLFNGVRSDEDSYAGLPRSQTMELRPWKPGWFHVIDPPGFVLGYSEYLQNPLWVAYRLQDRSPQKPAPRPKNFRVDKSTLMRVSADDYSRSGFDRGHLAPNFAMSRFHGRAAQLASFRMSNITPQKAQLNQKLWQRMEEIEASVYAADSAALYVIAGPVFDKTPRRLDSGVAVPNGFFRIWLRRLADGELQVLAFIVPQQVNGYEPLNNFLVAVDEVEALTGLDFYHHLPQHQQAVLEAQIRPQDWGFLRHARRPPRY